MYKNRNIKEKMYVYTEEKKKMRGRGGKDFSDKMFIKFGINRFPEEKEKARGREDCYNIDLNMSLNVLSHQITFSL